MGRPIQYNREQAIQAATHVFWQDGYTNSSVDKLVNATGLNKHSLYKAFDGKQGLFTACLEYYLEQQAAVYLEVLDENEGLQAIDLYFKKILAHKNKANSRNQGCLVVNTAVELGNEEPGIAKIVTGYYKQLTKKFRKALEQGQASGSIRSDLDTLEMARHLVHMVQGISVSKRIYRSGAPEVSVDTVLALIATAR